MKKTIIASVVAGLAFSAMAAHADVGQHKIGVIGEITDTGDSEDLNSYGLSYSYGNVYTSEGGYLYKAHATWKTGDEGMLDSTEYDVGLGTGYRVSLAPDLSFDVLAGIGYKNWDVDAVEFQNEIDVVYLNYGGAIHFDVNRDNALRLEVGSRYTIDGEIESSVAGMSGSENLKNRNNLYAEASWMTESTGIPLEFAIFHEKKKYKKDVSNTTLDTDTTGLKFSALF